ncbi:hypothetical protein M8C21_015161 [Ambrosia artemisiifolia]|uniref:Uncharacterized protein n=1 Tax=Ambrosia artemisiifolia TaxID=4212 RepID=A0AAD5G2E2_AMBAR|nr:hypothetical protein M8C21_015161 [Ambrosia artemisiifolia]
MVQGTRSSSEDAQSLSSVNEVHKPKPKPKSSTTNISSVSKESVKENHQKKLVSNIKASTNKKITNEQSVSEAGSCKIQKNFQKPIKKEFNKEKQLVKNKGKKSADEDVISCTEDAVTEENKENMDATLVEETSLEA